MSVTLLLTTFLQSCIYGRILAAYNDGPVRDVNRTSYVDPYGVKYRPEDFSKLTLNVRELFGSRWALDRNESINVTHKLFVTDAGLLHKNELTLRLEFVLVQSWIAPDLEFPVGLFKDSDDNKTMISAGVNVLEYMWSPDSYISSARGSNLRTQGSQLTNVYIRPDRKVIFKTRMDTKVSCTSSFQWYPVDVQTCDLVIESFKAQQNLRYIWNPRKPVTLKMRRLMQYELQLPVDHDQGINGPGPHVPFPFVRVKFTLVRKLGNNIIQVYTPTFLVVVLSWFSFWLGLDAIPGRISLLVTCMLTLVTMHGGIKSSIPPVHYITMMDVWLVCCMAMVFAAICEFVVVKYAHWRIQMKIKSQEKNDEIGNQMKMLNFLQMILSSRGPSKMKYAWDKDTEDPVRPYPPVCVIGKDLYRTNPVSPVEKANEKKKTPLWVAIDKLSRALFPTLFACFNGIYWPILLTRGTVSHDQEHAYYENI